MNISDKLSKMLNTTTRLAVLIQALSDKSIDWMTAPLHMMWMASPSMTFFQVPLMLQPSKRELSTSSHISWWTSSSHSKMWNLISHQIRAHILSKSQPLCPWRSCLRYKAQTMETLTRLVAGANLTEVGIYTWQIMFGKLYFSSTFAQVVIDDQLTWKFTKRWREPDQMVKLHLSWASEVPSKWLLTKN